MKTAKIVSIAASDQVGLYSICFNNGESEFRKFVKKFKDNAALNKDYQSILSALDRIIAKGAFERFFRYEGKMSDNVVALSLDSKKLRLYCLRMSDQILIVGNGGIKETRTYDEDEELSGYVHEPEGSLWRLRCDLTILLRREEKQTHPVRQGAVTIAPAVQIHETNY